MRVLLCFVFFLSGAAGLVFEALWFRMAALTLGGSIWASSLVLSSFMGGLALGNLLAARRGFRIRSPLRFYAGLEVVVGVAGAGLVVLFPLLPSLLAPVLEPFLGRPALLNPLRLGISFALLLVPTTAMGATLPIMVKALRRWSEDFGSVLGLLYGCNTVGAMTGVLAAELVLIGALGVTGTAFFALGLNLLAAGIAMAIHRRAGGATSAAEAPPAPASPAPGLRRFAVAAFVSGAILLALEVVWFRFLQLFVPATSLAFAVMLFVVLLGIGIGGLASGLWLRHRPGDYRLLPHLAVAAGLTVVWSYIRFRDLPGTYTVAVDQTGATTLWLSVNLMLPTALFSGVLFTFVGRAAFETLPEETGAVGRMTFFNTLGAMTGAAAAGWLLLPTAGIEHCLFFLAVAYAVVAACAPPAWLVGDSGRGRGFALAGVGMAFALSLALFPMGLMKNFFVPSVVSTYATPDTEIVEVREGLNETVIYTQDRWKGEVFATRLITNAISMASDDPNGKRYMKYFAYWPLAFHPRVEKALLISYGVGQTAKALTDSEEIEDIDIVDLSPDILDTHRILFPEPGSSPLEDDRVDVHVEDGRFYLLTTSERYDLITAEPPPLMMAGVVNLYTEEYFRLLRSRLRDGGYATYWLPVRLMAVSDTKAVIKAFCNVFSDCSLWRGGKLELVLAGSRGASGPVDAERFRRQWRDPEVSRELRALGLEVPELLLATFLGDARFLSELTEGAEPLTDEFPHRLARAPEVRVDFYYREMLLHTDAAKRYRESAYLQQMLPPELFESGLAHYPYQAMVDWALDVYFGERPLPLEPLHRVLTQTTLRTVALWLLGDFMEPSGAVEALVDEGRIDSEVSFILGLRALAERDFFQADEHFVRARKLSNHDTDADHLYYRILALAYAGERERAQSLVDELRASMGAGWESSEFGHFYEEILQKGPLASSD